MIKLIDQTVDFHENTDGLTIEKSQYIPDSFIQGLKDQRFESKHRKEGEFMRVASIPVAVIDNWTARGIDFWNMDAKKVVALLKTEGLDAFLTTDKQV